ncbi:CDP-glucose 4,6-dehydratase [Alphaproteobacteria bacterium]|nr:CDP-glucose 4,6-dehydratase [Alphaproteobacteria bacterium]MDC1023097.1 CDP-glucose 4,6-dehydratase [Alphaproteobacteria bacterium]
MFSNIYKDKKVLVTGHTGFKGSWLTTWLIKLGANVVGVSKDIPTNPSMFKELKLEERIKHYQEDIRDLIKISKIIVNEKPDFVFHLAAKAIVSKSYDNPLDTISSNVMGTTNMLEALRISNHKSTAIIITSDKAYDNIEQVWGYKENDPMGGKDVYSGSKGAAELIFKSYYHSFFKSAKSNVRLAVARAGNVIGGGDWAKDRIVVDCIEAWSKKKSVEIRNPESTRPWQHVLEPLSGYLLLGQVLNNDESLNGEGFNFGPTAEQNHTVKELLEDLSTYWGFENVDDSFTVKDNIPFHEAELLKLNCDKALFYFKWQGNMDYKDTIKFTGEWYYNFYNNDKNILDKTLSQINEYEYMAKEKGLLWTE